MSVLDLFWDTGIRLRCPVCEQGRLFEGWFTMHCLCPHCHVRFERHSGEVTGGMTISIVVTSLIFLIGYSLSEIFLDWPTWLQLLLWGSYALVAPLIFYRHSRALWVACLHLSGDVYWDKEPYEESQLSILDAFLHSPDEEVPPSDPSALDESTS